MPGFDDHQHRLSGPLAEGLDPGTEDEEPDRAAYGFPTSGDLLELTDFADFLRFSAELTGFDESELRDTGMAHEHHRALLAHRVRDEHALVHLWYVGAWPDEPPASPRAHDRGLMWRTFHGAAPGSTAPGHGSWAEAPQDGGAGR
ncbi:hypothetical protein OG401_04310 [Kitasatospora purpeofusca]|uniref:hypothetical protein n=1 Tax=Kitasatospora purpeofusca TaxID=67352 RepID=UPI0022576835|nr:hypothetical protein [Kitasatospora purpeofusca]MCX4683538.1 hypothetical protein [Kitasatospora purpeofusca]